jgi:hypothetical protein
MEIAPTTSNGPSCPAPAHAMGPGPARNPARHRGRAQRSGGLNGRSPAKVGRGSGGKAGAQAGFAGMLLVACLYRVSPIKPVGLLERSFKPPRAAAAPSTGAGPARPLPALPGCAAAGVWWGRRTAVAAAVFARDVSRPRRRAARRGATVSGRRQQWRGRGPVRRDGRDWDSMPAPPVASGCASTPLGPVGPGIYRTDWA